MDKRYQGLIYVAIMVFLAAFIADVETKSIDSYFNTLVAFTNFAVIAVITYFTYIINKKVASINENTLKFTKYQIINTEMKETNTLLGKLDEYISHNRLIGNAVLPHLSYSTKSFILSTKYHDKVDCDKIKPNMMDNIDMKTSLRIPLSEEEQEKFDYVERCFDHTIPSSVKARYRLRDIKISYDYLSEFKKDVNFYRFIKNSEFPKQMIDILEVRLEEILENNELSTKLIDLTVDIYTANSIHQGVEQVNQFLNNLKGLIIEEQRKLYDL